MIAREGQPFDGPGESLARKRYQKGRVFLRGKANPAWVGRWREDVIGADGSTRRVERSEVLGLKSEIPTQRLALRRLELLLCKVNSLDYRPGRIATLAEFAERWKETVLSQHKPSSQKAAQSHLQCHILPQLGAARLDAIGKEAQQVFVTRLSRTVSRKTVLNVVCTLSAMLRKAKEWGYVCERVDFGALELPEDAVKREPRFFTAKQVRQIIDAAEEPFRTMFAVLAMTGIRAGELLALQMDDLDFERKLIFIRRSVWYGRIQTTKSRASTKPLPMPGALSDVLRLYLESWKPNPTRLLFANRIGRPYSANKVVQRKLWPILDSLKMPRCGLHAFRHTHSSLLIELGAPATVAQEQLRHSDPRVTLAIYSHVIGDSQRNAVEKVAELLRPTQEASCAQLRPNAPTSEGAGQYIQ
jgi:integrase